MNELIINGVVQDDFGATINGVGEGRIINGVVQEYIKTLSITNTASFDTWNSKYSGVYTRALAMSVDDFESVSREASANVAPFYGARKVTNLFTYSKDISNANWLKSGGVTITGTDKFLADSSGDAVYKHIATEEAKTYALSFTASATLDKEIVNRAYRFYHLDSATGNLTNLYLTDTPARYSVTFTGKTGDGNVLIGFADYAGSFNPQQVTITDFLLEDVTGQSNQNGSDAVDTTSSVVTKYYNTDKDNINIYGRLWNKITGNYPDGGSIIGDSQVAITSPSYFSSVLNQTITAGVVNCGISGNSLAQIDTRFIADADPASHDFVIIEGGVNDILFALSDPNTSMRASLQSIATKCVSNGATPYFINISPWKGAATWNADRQTWTESYNTWLTEYCATNGYFLLDVYSAFGKDSDPAAPSEIFIDTGRLHWHDGANGYLAEIFYNIFAATSTTNTSTKLLTNTKGLAFAPATPCDYSFTNNNLIKATKGSIYIEFEAQPDYATADGTVLLANGACEIRCESDVSGISFNDGTNNTNGAVGVPSGVTKAVIVWNGTSVSITTANGTTTGTYAGNLGNATIDLGGDGTTQDYSGIISNIKFYYNHALTQAQAEVLIL